MFQSWTSLISRPSSSSSTSPSSSSSYPYSAYTHNLPYSTDQTSTTSTTSHLPHPPVNIIITPATPHLSHPSVSPGGFITPAGSSSSSRSYSHSHSSGDRRATGEMRSRRMTSTSPTTTMGRAHAWGRGARVLDLDLDRRVVVPEVDLDPQGHPDHLDEHDRLDEHDPEEEEEDDRHLDHWGPAYEDVPMNPIFAAPENSRSMDRLPLDESGMDDGYTRGQGGVRRSGEGYALGVRCSGNVAGGWTHFPSSRTGYRRLNPSSTRTSNFSSSWFTPSTSPAPSSPPNRTKLNLFLFSLALVLASLGMMSIMIPQLGTKVEFGVKVVVRGHGHVHGHLHPHARARGHGTTIVGMEEGLDGLGLSRYPDRGRVGLGFEGHGSDGFRLKSERTKRWMGMDMGFLGDLGDRLLPINGREEEPQKDDPDVILFPTSMDGRSIDVYHRTVMKQSRERLERRLNKVGRGRGRGRRGL